MARISNKILLGFEDEPITDKYLEGLDYTVNKVGGKPNWCGDAPTAVTCKLCGLHLPLVVQVYAPLQHSPYHRTLYIFACISPNCWNQNGSWVCMRSQIKADHSEQVPMRNDFCTENDWLGAGADNWGDEENGNIIDFGGLTPEDITDEMNKLSFDERNANSGGSVEGAMGQAMAAAIIEGDEGEVVCIDTPTAPEVNLIAMLEEATPMPKVPVSKLQFNPFFLAVDEEKLDVMPSPTSSEHIRTLINEYQENASDSSASGSDEKYEKSIPAHGDKIFYQFLSRIQANPTQIIRYGGFPLPLYSIQDKPRSCRHCGGEVLFELQIIPTLISRLKLTGSESGTHLEFGSVFLFSCAASCWDQRDSYREEVLVIQREKI